MTKMFKIDLPVGVTLWINGHEAHYIGGGSVVSTDPIWMIQGVTADGSEASRAWTRDFTIQVIDLPDVPSHRRAATCEMEPKRASSRRSVA
jgi:hypothetical protein